MITKAYECLTDEKARQVCEKFGNPDGPGSFNVAIAMPSFLLKKRKSCCCVMHILYNTINCHTWHSIILVVRD